ncbi:MAG: hypothetical protein IJ039_08515 [Clostridia bacterium]|nr:hypothetical protein [Clostridia bacterium]
MLYPSIQELLKATSKDGEERLNKYSMTMATAKCARIITNDYIEQRHDAERKVANKETDKDVASLVNKNYRDEKAVRNALNEMKEGKFEVYLPGEEGYEDSVVVVEDYVEPKEEFKPFKPTAVNAPLSEEETEPANEAYDDFDSQDLMDAHEVYTEEDGYTVADAEDFE